MLEKLLNFKKLRGNEKALLIGLAVAIGISIYVQAVHNPLSRRITRYKFQIQKSKSRLDELKVKFPQIEEERRNIHSLEVECKNLLDEITEIEKVLPSEKNTSQLIAELIRQAEGLNLTSVKQKLEHGGEYSRIFVELKLDAPYKDTINYIGRLESLSPFLVIEELDISEPKKKERQKETLTRLLISSLLGEIPTAEMFAGRIEKKDIEIERDIFVSKAKPVSRVRKTDLKLEGITYNPEGSTTIINGDVVKVGSEIGNLTIREILPDVVILTDGVEELRLMIER